MLSVEEIRIGKHKVKVYREYINLGKDSIVKYITFVLGINFYVYKVRGDVTYLDGIKCEGYFNKCSMKIRFYDLYDVHFKIIKLVKKLTNTNFSYDKLYLYWPDTFKEKRKKTEERVLQITVIDKYCKDSNIFEPKLMLLIREFLQDNIFH